MKIALVFPKSTFLIDPMVYPPLGLWYLAAHLEALGHETDFFDLSVDQLPLGGEFDQIWISATSAQMHSLRELASQVIKRGALCTVLGGSVVWANPHQCTDLGFDVIVSGEADYPEAIAGIIETAERCRGLHQGYLINLGTHVGHTPGLAPVRRWSHRYHAYLEDRNGVQHSTTTLFTSRGCPMACAFCESGRNGVIWDKFVRYEPIELVDQQLREIAELGYTGVMFYDDILPLNKPRTSEILKSLKKYGLIWRCFIRTDIIIKQGGQSYLQEMAEAGLVEVLAGVESADNRIKDNISKGTTIEQDTQVLYWCKELGIKFKASLILGLPGEDWDSLFRTRDWILTHRPDRADVNVLIPFPGTPITSRPNLYDLYWTEQVPEEFWYKGPRAESNAIVGTSHLTPEEIKYFHDELIKELTAMQIPY